MSNTLRICKVLEKPVNPDPNTLYLILNSSNEVTLMVSNSVGDSIYNVVSIQKLDPVLYYMLNKGIESPNIDSIAVVKQDILDPISFFMLSRK